MSRRFALPPRRALAGGALITMAALGVFSAHRSATAPVTDRFVVAARDVPAGTVLSQDDLGTVALDLPDDMAAISAENAGDLIGRVTTGRLHRLELVSDDDVFTEGRFRDADSVEVALDLPGARALAGVATAGSIVDVLSTDSDRGGTETLAEGVRISSVDEARSASIGSSSAVRVVLSLNGADAARKVVDASLRADLTLVLPRPSAEGDR